MPNESLPISQLKEDFKELKSTVEQLNQMHQSAEASATPEAVQEKIDIATQRKDELLADITDAINDPKNQDSQAILTLLQEEVAATVISKSPEELNAQFDSLRKEAEDQGETPQASEVSTESDTPKEAGKSGDSAELKNKSSEDVNSKNISEEPKKGLALMVDKFTKLMARFGKELRSMSSGSIAFLKQLPGVSFLVSFAQKNNVNEDLAKLQKLDVQTDLKSIGVDLNEGFDSEKFKRLKDVFLAFKVENSGKGDLKAFLKTEFQLFKKQNTPVQPVAVVNAVATTAEQSLQPAKPKSVPFNADIDLFMSFLENRYLAV